VPRLAVAALTAAVALCVPGVLTLNGVRALANDWYVRLEYRRLPADRYGLDRRERTELGLVGLHSVEPGGRGIRLLREARLPSGKPAFGQRELRHMRDVRRWLGRIYPAHLLALAALAALALLLSIRPASRGVVPRGLAAGAWVTLALAAAAVVLVLTSYETFEESFHGLLFETGTWRFRDADTLRRLYPDRFWSDTAAIVGAAAVLQALAILALPQLVRRRRGKAKRPPERTRG